MSDLMKIIISCSPVGAVFNKCNDLNTRVFMPDCKFMWVHM